MFSKPLRDLTEADIDAATKDFYESQNGAGSFPGIKPTVAAPIFNAAGAQILNPDGTPKVMMHGHSSIANYFNHQGRGLLIDPATTLSSDVAVQSLLLGAMDVFAVTRDNFMVMGVRAKGQNASSVGALKTFDSASGFRRLVKGTLQAEAPMLTAQRELSEEMGLSIPLYQFQSIHPHRNLQRLLHYPEIALKDGSHMLGHRPTFSDAFFVQLDASSKEIESMVTVSAEHDGVVALSVSDALKVLSGSVAKVNAILYKSDRLLDYTDAQSIPEIYAGTKIKPDFASSSRAKLLPPQGLILTPDDCSLNGSMVSGVAKAKLLSDFLGYNYL